MLCTGTASAASMFYIRGGGDGHGIGMGQYGALGYAQHGKDYRFILAHFYQRTALGNVNPNRTVRVLLKTGSAAFSGASRAGKKRLNPAFTYSVGALANGSLVLIGPSGKKIAMSPAPLTVSGRRSLNLVGAGTYRGALQFRASGGGAIQTVEAVGLDDYVRGVISAEVPASWPLEALKAQAVAARTYAITTNVGGAAFDVYPDTRSQMYRGVAAETPPTNAAVAGTRGQVVTYRNVPVVTYFFNSSGGHTENIEVVWPGATPEPWLRGVPDPYDGAGGDPYHRWGYNLTMAAASARLGGLVKGALIGIRVTKRGSSPRIVLAQVVGTRGRSTVTGIQLQHIFGLLTTYAVFTTITTEPGQPPAPPRHSRDGARHSRDGVLLPGGDAGAQAVVALVPLVRSMVSGFPALHGTVFPEGPKGAPITIQSRVKGRWRTVLHSRLGAGGNYAVQLPGAGTYRISYNGLSGPAVTVS
jgi:stage II sporulation protein D